jgi:hypothetical protein
MEIKQLNHVLEFFNNLVRQGLDKIEKIGKTNQKSIMADIDKILKDLQGTMQIHSKDIQETIDNKEIDLIPIQEAIKSLQEAVTDINLSDKIEIPKFPDNISIKEANEIINALSKIVEEIRDKNLKVDLTTIEKGLLGLQNTLSKEISEIGKNIPKTIELPMEEDRIKVILPDSQVPKIFGGGGSISDVTIRKNIDSVPRYDSQEIDESDPNNVIIIYKKGGTTVATKTIVISGTTTTITLT